jgi:hypothetical protein
VGFFSVWFAGFVPIFGSIWEVFGLIVNDHIMEGPASIRIHVFRYHSLFNNLSWMLSNPPFKEGG